MTPIRKAQIIGFVIGVAVGTAFGVAKPLSLSTWQYLLLQIAIQIVVTIAIFAFLEWRAFRKEQKY